MRNAFFGSLLFLGAAFFSPVYAADVACPGTCVDSTESSCPTGTKSVTGYVCNKGFGVFAECCVASTAPTSGGTGTPPSTTATTCTNSETGAVGTCAQASSCTSIIGLSGCGNDTSVVCCGNVAPVATTPPASSRGAASTCYGDKSGYQGTCQTASNCNIANTEQSTSSSPTICQDSGLVCCIANLPSGGNPAIVGNGTNPTGYSIPTGGVPSGVQCSGRMQGGICFPITGLSSAPIYFILSGLLNWLLGILGFIGIIAFVISGMQYLLSAGNEEMIETAKRNMTWSIVGVVVALSGFVIIQAISNLLSGGWFSMFY